MSSGEGEGRGGNASEHAGGTVAVRPGATSQCQNSEGKKNEANAEDLRGATEIFPRVCGVVVVEDVILDGAAGARTGEGYPPLQRRKDLQQCRDEKKPRSEE